MEEPLRILLATDAWKPQVNGVVRTMETTTRYLTERGHHVEVIEPGQFPGFPVPFYPEIKLALPLMNQIARRATTFRPTAVHISTEGPIGVLMRTFCLRKNWRFTTSYHTRFPEYLSEMTRLPLSIGYSWMKWFHRRSSAIMVATPSLQLELAQRDFTSPLRRWSRGVDLTLFKPRPRFTPPWPRPILLYAGRISKEKNIEEFLKIQTPGTKVVVGDGPTRTNLEKDYPDVIFLGYRRGEALAEVYANADLFVFPSKTDTFGLVIIEALACGVPVAAYPVTGPKDILTTPETGALDENLGLAVERALKFGRAEECIRLAHEYTWERCTTQFQENLVSIR